MSTSFRMAAEIPPKSEQPESLVGESCREVIGCSHCLFLKIYSHFPARSDNYYSKWCHRPSQVFTRILSPVCMGSRSVMPSRSARLGVLNILNNRRCATNLKNASQIRVTLIRFGIDWVLGFLFFSGMFHLYVSTGSGFGSVLTAT